MASLTWFSVSTPRKVIPNNQAFKWRSSKLPRQVQKPILRSKLRKGLTLCSSSNLFPWEASPPYATTEDGDGIIKGSNIVEPIDADDKLGIPIFQGEEEAIIDMKSQSPTLQHPLKWPMWLLGPSVLLATGMAPTLWLPLSSVFLGPNIAGLLSLVGLDCLFNMGATLFLLMADACGRHPTSNLEQKIQVPATYKLWKLVSSLLGLLVPLILLFASQRGSLEPQASFISFAVLLGPYLLLLSVQMLTEMLTWHWRSPVWIVTPLVYEAYRVLQLMRGLKLAGEIGSPAWVTVSIRGLVSWWVLILGVQLMSVAWFVGVASRVQQNGSA